MVERESCTPTTTDSTLDEGEVLESPRMSAPSRASTLTDAAFGPALDPLMQVRPDHEWYVNLDAQLPPEHYGVGRRLRALFRANAQSLAHLHVGLVGQGGTGKSTLVRQAMADLRDVGILPVFVNARESFDQVDMAFADVVLVLVEAVVRELVERAATIQLDPMLLERVRRWFAEEVIGEDQRREIVGDLGSEASAGLDIPLIAQFATRVRGTLRSSNDYRREIRQRAARDPDELLSGANALLDGVHKALAARKQRLCVVFDNLEKIHDRQQIDAAILSRAEDLRRLRCHVIYFFSPADQYAPVTIQANQLFKIIEVPVIPVRIDRAGPKDQICEEAMQAITKLLERRLDIDTLFTQPENCVHMIAAWSGGRLRDIIELARQACEFAEFDPRAGAVDGAHIERAAPRWRMRWRGSTTFTLAA